MAVAYSQEESSISDEVGEEQLYVSEIFKDWKKICRKDSDEEDLCHIYQLILDENDHPTSELTLYRIENEEGVSAVATVLVPLETLLTSNLSLNIDKGVSVEFPFSWCDKRGCYARIAFTDDDVFSMRNGQSGTIKIFSISSADKAIILKLSFLGFIDAFTSLQ